MLNKCVYIPKKQIDKTLRMPSKKGKRPLEPFLSFALKNKLPFKIIEDAHISNKAEIHECEGDLVYCLEGKITFSYGGKPVNKKRIVKDDGSYIANEFLVESVKNGQRKTLGVGDWIWIPAGQPHQHGCSSISRMIIIKIPVSK